MIVKLEDDFADEIVVATLAESYVNIKDMLKNEASWHEDDVAAWKKLLPAMELVGGWYSVDFKAAIKLAKKGKK
jgi:hypothetical protein